MTQSQFNFIEVIGGLTLIILAIITVGALIAVIGNAADKKPYNVRIAAMVAIPASLLFILGTIAYFFLLGSEYAA